MLFNWLPPFFFFIPTSSLTRPPPNPTLKILTLLFLSATLSEPLLMIPSLKTVWFKRNSPSSDSCPSLVHSVPRVLVFFLLLPSEPLSVKHPPLPLTGPHRRHSSELFCARRHTPVAFGSLFHLPTPPLFFPPYQSVSPGYQRDRPLENLVPPNPSVFLERMFPVVVYFSLEIPERRTSPRMSSYGSAMLRVGWERVCYRIQHICMFGPVLCGFATHPAIGSGTDHIYTHKPFIDVSLRGSQPS